MLGHVLEPPSPCAKSASFLFEGPSSNHFILATEIELRQQRRHSSWPHFLQPRGCRKRLVVLLWGRSNGLVLKLTLKPLPPCLRSLCFPKSMCVCLCVCSCECDCTTEHRSEASLGCWPSPSTLSLTTMFSSLVGPRSVGDLLLSASILI